MASSDDDNQPSSSKKIKFIEVCLDDQPDRMQEIFYNLSADCEFCFADGKVIRFNKGLFYNAVRSDSMFQILYGPLKDDKTIITDIDSDAFKIFLECVMGFKPTTKQNALEIFPIIWKYQIEKWLDKCIEILVPHEIDEEMCLTLNMAVSYDCDILQHKILHLILFEKSPHELLENKSLLFLLEPRSLYKIIKKIDLDSVIVKVMIGWGINYLEKNNTNFKTVRSLFEHYKIMNQIQFKFFMTTDELFKFIKSDGGKNFYTWEEIVAGMESQFLEHNKKSEWKFIKGGDSFTEEFNVLLRCYKLPIDFHYTIELNNIVCYNTPGNAHEIWLEGETVVDEGLEHPFCIMNGEIEKRWHSKNSLELSVHFSESHRNDKFKIKLAYRFRYDCRILMMTKPENFSEYEDRTYFAKKISLLVVD